MHLVKQGNGVNKELVETLELLLENALSGNLTGIAGVYAMRKEHGQFCYGSCGDNPNRTLLSLDKLVSLLEE